jgi:hypothetical protein
MRSGGYRRQNKNHSRMSSINSDKLEHFGDFSLQDNFTDFSFIAEYILAYWKIFQGIRYYYIITSNIPLILSG